ncbi:hypothetical protein NTGBS_190011 [Candidatus Nitrotoga sp. BS]|uniref:hypothetical protein n=1 Tax=Candidatus Nitrotoga sp. BS TaxID=2890408 RepID=UPI001EF219DC|nr:hypothetical protein [Candidatus Nitrotoga sp. BS]CAH1194852.1 hypothetical protein NTGBS_190011 [Candidatus Nitrotoga sp. BS]
MRQHLNSKFRELAKHEDMGVVEKSLMSEHAAEVHELGCGRIDKTSVTTHPYK